MENGIVLTLNNLLLDFLLLLNKWTKEKYILKLYIYTIEALRGAVAQACDSVNATIVSSIPTRWNELLFIHIFIA